MLILMNLILNSSVLMMSSREIAELTGKRHDHVRRDIENMLSELGQTSPQFWGELPDSYGRPQKVALLPKDLSITLVAGYNVVMRHAIVKRWQELEAGQAPKIPQTLAQALRLAADQAEQLEIQAPKVAFFDRVAARETLMTATQVAQKVGKSAIALNKMLDDLDVYSRNVKRARVFKHWFIDAGYGELKQTDLGYSQPLFTPAGEIWVIQKLVSEGIA